MRPKEAKKTRQDNLPGCEGEEADQAFGVSGPLAGSSGLAM